MAEQVVIKVVRAKLFVFVRRHRHELFTEEFQAELVRPMWTVRRGARRASPQPGPGAGRLPNRSPPGGRDTPELHHRVAA